ncbi:hypothetical protein GGS26DRAFT_549068 [Hypomontagnella submonticulosa]|nr:hypothetical protein GGS26DRAFT_549068 [Hypomontagnella submonticulosa]
MFSTYEGSVPYPRSLYHVFGSGSQSPSPEQRFTLTLQPAQCVSNLQMMKWVHRSFHSGSISFFPRQTDRNPASMHIPGEPLNFTEP